MVTVTNVAQHPGVSPPFVGDIPTVYSHSESGWTFPTPGCICRWQLVAVIEQVAECVVVRCLVVIAVFCGNGNYGVTAVVEVINCNGYRFGPVALLAVTCNVESMHCGK